MGFNPFARHTENQPSKPNDQGKNASTPEPQTATAGNVAETEEKPPAKPVEEKPASAARTGKAINPFASYATKPRYRPDPERALRPPAQELLIWIQQCWNRPTISLRDIQTYAPRDSRDRRSATKHVETLEQHGWLTPLRAHRRDRRIWRTPPAGATEIPED
jgi:hypothetical protein